MAAVARAPPVFIQGDSNRDRLNDLSLPITWSLSTWRLSAGSSRRTAAFRQEPTFTRMVVSFLCAKRDAHGE